MDVPPALGEPEFLEDVANITGAIELYGEPVEDNLTLKGGPPFQIKRNQEGFLLPF
jgi:hypothetical protein